MQYGIRRLLTLAWAVGLAGLLATAPQLAHAVGQPGECTPVVVFHAEIRFCYLPAHRVVAERRLSPRPLNPIPTVSRLTHLSLGQIIVLSGTGAGAPGPAFSIVYVFGTPIYSGCAPTSHCSVKQRYVLIQETIGHLAVMGVQVENTGGVPGPWSLDANIPGRNLSLHIVTNAIARGLVLEIGHRLLTLGNDPHRNQ